MRPTYRWMGETGETVGGGGETGETEIVKTAGTARTVAGRMGEE